MRVRGLGAGGALAAVAVLASCSAGRHDSLVDRIDASVAAAASPEAQVRLAELRTRLPASGAAGLRNAHVELPARASGAVRLEDDTSHVTVRFALRGAPDVPVAKVDDLALYAGALEGADVVHRVRADGTEDYVVFESKPAQEELAYDIDVSHVARLHLVSNTLELLDEGGSPGLRIAPPYVVDAKGERHEARLAVGRTCDAKVSAARTPSFACRQSGPEWAAWEIRRRGDDGWRSGGLI